MPRTHRNFRAIPVALGVSCLLVLAACASRAGQVPGAAADAATTPAVTGTSPASRLDSSPSAAHPVGTETCTGSQLAITLTHTGAVANEAGGYLTFTNRGSVPCELTGWPAVAGVTRAGNTAALARATSTMFGAWQLTSPAPVLTLTPGDSAYAVVVGDELPVGSATSCPAPYTRIAVTAPGGSSPTVLSAWLPGADTYLPACTTISGAAADEVSEIVPAPSLAR